ncbi:MarR family winged helix-turn-helix transcriptional regulator [Sphingomonas sp. LHG3443-2]|uniref:MarR family winged helix-turn-helix transcriptional regulator n=1 Tax=Sphingomonas sp. LHG3443-2 TaxID=2804639 RepID=UPI003CF9AFCA
MNVPSFRRNDCELLPNDGDGDASLVAGIRIDEVQNHIFKTLRMRSLRNEIFEVDIFYDPGWDILLYLFAKSLSGDMSSVSSVCAMANCPSTTALRYIDHLESAGLVTRAPHASDRRSSLLFLTQAGRSKFQRLIDRFPDSDVVPRTSIHLSTGPSE